MNLDIIIFGLSISSSWGNGHAVTYRALAKALNARGHRVKFIERDVPWYREHRDLPHADYCRIELYEQLRDVSIRFNDAVAAADLVILGSYVPDGAILADWITSRARGVTAFYDIDTPVTLAALDREDGGYITARLIPRFDLYLSFTGGPVLELIEDLYGSPRARPLYCTADVDIHAPCTVPSRWALGYLGTYSADRQQALDKLLLQPAQRLPDSEFVVAGPQYPATLDWPANIARIDHVAPHEHQHFYGQQRYTLNITRADMIAAGFSPSVRLFEAAACGVPIISDRWPGLDSIFTPGQEILTVETPQEVVQVLQELPEEQRRNIAAAARRRFLASHTPEHRASQLEAYYHEVAAPERRRTRANGGTRAALLQIDQPGRG